MADSYLLHTYSKEEICLSMKTFQLRESAACYNGISGIKNSDIGAKNGHFWNINLNISR